MRTFILDSVHAIRRGGGVLILVLAAFPAQAQNGPDNDPDAAQGYVNSVFHHSALDSINLYNGQLTIPIALGPSYPIGPKLKFQAMLTYTSRAWEFGHPSDLMVNPPPPNLPPTLPFEPVFGDPALGIGWNFSLGAIKPCGLAQASRCYVSPDGAEHLFDMPVFDEAHFKTRDGSQLSLHSLDGTRGYEMWDGDGNHYVFDKHVEGFDDQPGSYFHDFGRGRDGWYLGSLTDPFGNGITVTYYSRGSAIPCPSFRSDCPNTSYNPDTSMRCAGTGAGAYSWVPQSIRLPGGSLISIGLDTQPATAQMIRTFSFPVLSSGQPTSAIWRLNHQKVTFAGFYCSVPLAELSSLELPDTLPGAPKYLFEYAAQSDGLMAGTVLLTKMTVPTGASLQYEYGDYSFYHGRVASLSAGPTCQPKGPPADAAVIKSSILIGPSAPKPPEPNAGDPCVPIAASDYVDARAGVLRKTETLSVTPAAVTNYTQYAFPFGEQGAPGSGDDKSQTLTVVVGPADGDGRVSARSVLFWSGPRSGSFFYCGSGSKPLAPCPGDRTGAEIRQADYDHDPNTIGANVPMPGCGGNDLEFCPSHAVRVLQRTYEYDVANSEFGNRRVQRELTFHQATASDGSCAGCQFHQVDFSPSELVSPGTWEANGRHYRTEKHSGNLGNDIRTIETNWTPANWTAPPPPGASALPNLFDFKTEKNDGPSVDQYFYFDGSNGFLKGSAIWEGQALPQSRLFLTCLYSDTGGAVRNQVTLMVLGFPEPRSNPCYADVSSFSTIGSSQDLFARQFTYQNGLLTSARWMTGPASGASWYVKRYDRDAATGWVTRAYDTAGVATAYLYDLLGRPTCIEPSILPGAQATLDCSTPNGAEAPVSVNYPSTTRTIATRNSGGAGLSTYQQYEYDRLGRLVRDIHRMPGVGQYAVRTHAFDAPGHRIFDSEWGRCGNPTGDCLTAAPPGTASSGFDPFGRPQAMRKADGSTAGISYASFASPFSDTNKTVTVNNIGGACSGGGCTGGSPAVTLYVSDAFGRLTSVTEPGGDITRYTYDVNGKLAGVTQGAQTRSFLYDAAGNLRREITPERGQVSYDDVTGVLAYGSLGNPLRETLSDGVVRLRCYDYAGRLRLLRTSEDGDPNCAIGPGESGRTYLQNDYDQNPSQFNLSSGKPTTRVGRSYSVLPPPQPATLLATVTDSMAYGGLGGRLSSLETRVIGNQSLITTQGWQYNGLGLLAHHYHPRPLGASPFLVSQDYDAGLPVMEYVQGIPMVKGLGYQPSGSLAAYTTGVGAGDVTTTITQDASQLPRPASIVAVGPAAGFSTGLYAYDGDGNITLMGPDSFAYDSRSRLTSATLAAFGGQTYAYDRYGNLLQKGGTTFCAGTCANNQVPGASYARGNLTGYAGQSFTWDALDRMASSQSSLTFQYLYDGGDERLAKIPPTGSWTYTIRDESKRVASEFSGTTVSRDNVFLGNQLVLSYANVAVGGNGPAWVFYASDHLGTPRLLTDVSGSAVEPQPRRYWPYGEAATAPGSFQALRFATMEFDAESGPGLAGDRYYDHARSHVGGLGRFLSPDSVGGHLSNPQSWNRYAYTLGNPLKHVDPDGRLTILVHGSWAHGASDFQPGGRFFETVATTVRDRTVVSFQWSGGNSRAARQQAAAALKSFIGSYKFAPGEKLNMVAHSHGSNVSIAAINLGVGHRVDNLVTLGTPARPDYVLNDRSAVGKWINVSNPHDAVQTMGGNILSGFSAGRNEPGALNLFWNADSGPLQSHTQLHSPEVWNFVLPRLELPTDRPAETKRMTVDGPM